MTEDELIPARLTPAATGPAGESEPVASAVSAEETYPDAPGGAADVGLEQQQLESWSARALERRGQRRRRGLRGAWDAFREWPVWQQIVVAVPAVLVVIVLAGALVDTAASAGRIHPGVTASGVPVGGMTREDAVSTLESKLAERLAAPVTVRFEEATWTVSAEQLKADPDEAAAAQTAFQVGRSGGFLESVGRRVALWFEPFDVVVPVSADASTTAAVIEEIAGSVDREPRDATIVVEGTEPRVVPAELGVAVRRDVLERDILAGLVGERKDVEVSAGFVPVQVTDDGAAEALEETRRMLSGPVRVTFDSASWEFSATEIAGWLAFRPVDPQAGSSAETSGAAGAASQTATGELDLTAEGDGAAVGDASGSGATSLVLEAYVDVAEASATITPRVGEAGHPAVDASFKASGGKVTIVPSQDGTGPDLESLSRELTVVLKGSGERTVELKTQRVEPDLTTAEAQAMGISERISTYTTTYDSGNKPRVNNIHTLADAVDGTLVGPGETFSFNETVGPRTAAKGYQEANAIVNGKLVPQLGGGICQFGTTIFNAVFESGLPVVERKNHSIYISHYPKGRDATVSWGGPDFKFKNDTDKWILVATGYSNSSVTVSLYGTDPAYEVKSSTGPWTNVKPAPVKRVDDPTLPVGTEVVEQSGDDGRTIVVTRTVYKNGAVLREDSFKSVYKTSERIIRVGTMPVSTGTTQPVTTP